MPVQRSPAKARAELRKIAEASARRRRVAASEAKRKKDKQTAQPRLVYPKPRDTEGAVPNALRYLGNAEHRANVRMHKALVAAGERKQKPQPEKPTYSTKRPKDAKEKLAKARTQARQRQGYKTFHQLEKRQRKEQTAAIARLPFVDKKDVREAEAAVMGIPAGMYGLGKAATLDVVKPRGGPLDFKHSRTAPLVGGLAKQYARDIRHPLRNPLLTALDISGFYGAGAGTAARLGRASAAARAGEGVGGALKAAAKRPLPEVRVHTYTGPSGKPVTVRGRYSIAPGSAAIQKALDRRTGGAIGGRKVAGLMHEEQRVMAAVRKAPAMKTLAGSHKVTTPEDLAIRMVGETPPGVKAGDWAAYHEARAQAAEVKLRNRARGGNRPGKGYSMQQRLRLERYSREHARMAALYREAERYVEETPEGLTIKAEYPALQQATASTAKTALLREKRMQGAGELSLQAAEGRKNAPAEMARRTVSGGRAVKIERPRNVAEARDALAKLDTRIEKITGPLIERLYQENRDAYDLQANLSYGAGGRGAKEIPKGVQLPRYEHGGQLNAQEMEQLREYTPEAEAKANIAPRKHQPAKQLAEAEFWRRIATSKHATAKRLQGMVEEASALRSAVEAHTAPTFMRETNLPGLGTTTEFRGIESVEPLTGAPFRVPDYLPSKAQPPHGPVAWRGGVVRKPGTITHEYTGAARIAGKQTPHTMRAVAEDAIAWERYDMARQYAERVRPTGAAVRPADTPRVKYAPVRLRNPTKVEAQQLREALADVRPDKLTVEQAERIDAMLAEYDRQYFPDEGGMQGARWTPYGKKLPEGSSVPGIVWVDKRLLASTRQRWGRLPVVDDISDAVKGLILYGKPGYVAPNVIGNLGYNLMQQGVLQPGNFTRALRLPDDLKAMMDESMGAGFSRALAEGTMSPISHAVQWGGNTWGKVVDLGFRRAALLHELRRVGIRSDAEIRAFFERGHPRQAEILQRARDSIIDYERLGPAERDYIRKVIFIYPWIKGSTWYAAQFLRDHPVQASVYAQIGRQGTSTAAQELGPMPAWAQGSFKVGGTAEKPYIVNPAALSNFGTPAQLLGYGQGLLGRGERSQQLGEATNPVLQSAIETLWGRDLFTGKELTGNKLQQFFSQTGQGLPQYLLYKRGGLNFLPGVDQHVPPGATYPYTPAQAWGQFVAGSSFPRPANRQKLNEQAIAALSPVAKARASVGKERDEFRAMVQKVAPELLHNGSLPASAKRAFALKTQVEVVRAKAQAAYGKQDQALERNRAKFEGYVDLLAKWGVMSKADAARAKKRAATGTVDDFREANTYISSHYFEDAYLRDLNEARRYLREHP